jgi:hypothetical protein
MSIFRVATRGLQYSKFPATSMPADRRRARTRRSRPAAEVRPGPRRTRIELSGDLTEEFYIGGVKTAGTMARVNLMVTDGTDEFSWDAPVWFCEPWPHPFGLAGLEGFLQHFLVTIHAYHGYLEIGVSVLNRGADGAVLVPGQPGRRGPLRGSGYFP